MTPGSRATGARPGMTEPMKLLLVVAVALVDADNRVLIAQRPEGKQLAGLWEFPGGKLDAGERPEAALIRELHEELGIEVKEACLAPLTFASHAYDDFHLLMPLYICRRWEGQVQRARGPAARLGPRQQTARLPDAAGGYPADPAADRFADVSVDDVVACLGSSHQKSSCAGLTRASIFLRRQDGLRVKPGE